MEKLFGVNDAVLFAHKYYFIFSFFVFFSFCVAAAAPAMIDESEFMWMAQKKCDSKKKIENMESNKIRFGIGHCSISHMPSHTKIRFLFYVVCRTFVCIHTHSTHSRYIPVRCRGRSFCMDQCTLYVLCTTWHTVSIRSPPRPQPHLVVVSLFGFALCVCLSHSSVHMPRENLGKGCRLLIFNKNS